MCGVVVVSLQNNENCSGKMLNKSNIIKLFRSKRVLQKYCTSAAPNTSEASTVVPESVRQREWLAARGIYKDHVSLLYSSVLELNNYYKIKQQIFEKNFFKKHGKKLKESVESTPEKIVNDETDLVKNWMDDYEFYEGGADESGALNTTHGTADPSVPPSTVPCNGCGAHLHCMKTSLPGYIPKEIFAGRTKAELQTIICQRCHFLNTYNIALDVEVTPETYIETISKIKDEFALAVVIVDLLDFPCSIWPGMQELLGSKRPVFIVGNKVDLLPRDSNGYLNHIKESLTKLIKGFGGFDPKYIKYIGLISAKTGYGIEELITQLHKTWKHKGNVYLMGCTNVGKSSLFNTLLNSDYCRPEASDLVRKATTCPWPGTTLQMLKFPILRPSDYRISLRYKRLFSERSLRAAEAKLRKDQALKTGSIQAAKLSGYVGRTFLNQEEVFDAFAQAKGTEPIVTLNEKRLEYKEAKWCHDTPGVMHPAQVTNLLTNEELIKIQPEEMILPRAVRLPYEGSVFLGGLGRLDFINYSFNQPIDWLKVFIFASQKLPITIVPTKEADEFYKDYLGSNILEVPCGSAERLKQWPGLHPYPSNIEITSVEEKFILSCDILFSSAGWIGLDIPKDAYCSFKAWSPFSRGIYVRQPPLVRQAERLVGKKIKYSLAYNSKSPFVFRK